MASAGPEYRGRFAPSPTGSLHLGSLVAALGSWLMARHRGGEWWVRIEDLDPPREVPGMALRQLEALAGFGLVSDAPVAWQSQRSELYQSALDRLIASDLAFPCFCSRSDLLATAGMHRGCVAHPSGRQPTFRLRVPAQRLCFEDAIRGPFCQDLAEQVGDVVLRRADGLWAYQLAVVVDDALQGMTDVVRGADLLDSTPRQILLQRTLGYHTPAYAHLPLIRNPGGRKLGKSLGELAVDATEPLPSLRLAYRLLGQDSAALDGAGTVEQELQRALLAFQPGLIPAVDCVLGIE